jgi:thiamine kinase-like enzyme
MSIGPSEPDLARMTRALGWRPTSSRPASADRGPSETGARWIVADGRRSAFVKVGATPLTAEWIRREHINYQTIHGAFMPTIAGFDDDGDRPVLALEDLSDADWPPPWSTTTIGAVLDALATVHRLAPPSHLGPEPFEPGVDWQQIEADPKEFLALGLCSDDWLRRALPALRTASALAPLEGDALVHLDIRSDNVCFRGTRAILIDWSHAALANADLDIAAWLPSLHAEGGSAPETILPGASSFAAWTAGFFCARAGLPDIPEAPHVRPLQRMQARTALAWAARAFDLPPPEGAIL